MAMRKKSATVVGTQKSRQTKGILNGYPTDTTTDAHAYHRSRTVCTGTVIEKKGAAVLYLGIVEFLIGRKYIYASTYVYCTYSTVQP